MCAIGGILDPAFSNPSSLRHPLQHMAQAMFRRGPDEEGSFLEPGIGLIHRRLSIVGLSNGRQPLSNEDGSIVTISNGEFFDHIEKRAWLQSRGHVLRTSSDCEIIAHLYEEYGPDFVHHLRGQFAFALWDKRKNLLFLGRDRSGILPLHWARHKKGIVFASEIKGILASGLVDAAPDHRGIDHIFTFLAQPARRTCFAGIESLLPGTMFRASLGPNGVTTHEIRYWDLSFPDRGQEYDPGPSRIVEEFGQHFEESVRIRLRADVPVVGYLSGGLDSSAIVATACRLRSEPIPAFSVRIPTRGFDEISKARLVANHTGSPLIQLTCDDALVGQSFPELIEAADAPVVDTSCAALLNLSRMVREQGYKVALTGEGSDELLAGYIWLKVGRLLGCLDRGTIRPGNLVRFLALKLFNPHRPWEDANRYQSYIGGPQGISDLYGMCGDSRQRFFSSAMWEQVGHHIAFEDLDLNLEAMKRWDPLNQALYFGHKTLLPGMLLCHKGDRIAMRNSVETRYPFLDENVVDFCSSIHPRWKLRGLSQDKHILRSYASKILPESIWQQPKQMFRAPLGATFFSGASTLTSQLLSEESLRRSGFFQPSAVRKARQSYEAGELGTMQRVFVEMGLTAVISTQLWHHKYLGGGLCDLPEADFRTASAPVDAPRQVSEAPQLEPAGAF